MGHRSLGFLQIAMDEELRRIAAILKEIDKLSLRLMKMRRRLGDDAYKRAMKYVQSRKRWQIEQLYLDP